MEVNVERLKELRRERVLSLRELEERSGVSYNTIWRIEDGRGRTLGPCGSWRRLWAFSPPSL
jgi:transcriptional regulator with XRE-family HTH domain